MSEVVTSSSRVLADVTIKLKDGSVADSTKVSGKPSWLVMGDGSFSDAFEDYLLGAKVNDTLTFELPAKDAFGESIPDNIHFMDISQFPQDVKLEKGAIVGFESADGGQIPGIIREIQASSVKVDFNHPLAGEDIVFEVEIKQIAA
ncbi:FKBP-type peptidyl-prolyl cis-trans isomerase [Aliikangiella marina]|uniref:Peptidyl-prolyl cis-trans isomerase n=1 Tax=Aliikangiella marina TaxID=1712262 RepID=A0A545THX1_9GAMM|nr:FKBP-type peptidyl-prolyl cis-trans isomerase [Aliikangiella marina]TQV76827.1 FKBP-type peptidyl-prolyl cis-trans isomerase [Aliikangiella marina]